MVLSLASAVVAWAILARIAGLDPSSAMIAPIYLNLLTQSSFSPLTLMSVLKPLVSGYELFIEIRIAFKKLKRERNCGNNLKLNYPSDKTLNMTWHLNLFFAIMLYDVFHQ